VALVGRNSFRPRNASIKDSFSFIGVRADIDLR
jgi:hypothetical protein